MRVLPMGDRAVLVEVGSVGEVLNARALLAASAPAGVVDLVPAARTVLVQVDPAVLALPTARGWIARALREGGDAAQAAPPVTPVALDIVYDGPDLATTADLLGLSADALAGRHAAAEWTVAFTGFAPGFAYLMSEAWNVDVPRLDSPRTRVPAGAVGLAGEFSGAYPRETPGGWRLIGTTTARLFDPAAAAPALLTPGTPVRFARVRAGAQGGSGGLGAQSGLGGITPSASGHASGPGSAPGPEPEPGPESGRESASRRGPAPESAPESAPDRPPPITSGPLHASGPPAPPTPPASPTSTPARTAVRVVAPGLLATVQDLGRPGRSSLGIAPSGALDRAALRLANRLVGNAEHAAGLELTMGGFTAVAERDLWIAVTGAAAPLQIDGRDIAPCSAAPWRAGETLVVGWAEHGARLYLAVRGGVDAPVVADSRSTDLLAGLGLPPLAPGSALGVAADAVGPIPPHDLVPWGAPPADAELEIAPGPRADWFAASARRSLYEATWTVTNDADRVGVRLDGPALAREVAGELPSEGMMPGALQVPPSGRPTVLLADGPVTGGYPVIAVVADASLDALAQLRPGARILFRHARARV